MSAWALETRGFNSSNPPSFTYLTYASGSTPALPPLIEHMPHLIAPHTSHRRAHASSRRTRCTSLRSRSLHGTRRTFGSVKKVQAAEMTAPTIRSHHTTSSSFRPQGFQLSTVRPHEMKKVSSIRPDESSNTSKDEQPQQRQQRQRHPFFYGQKGPRRQKENRPQMAGMIV